jgi:hypothetical protein
MENHVLRKILFNKFPSFVLIKLVKDICTVCPESFGVVGFEYLFWCIFNIADVGFPWMRITENAED